MKVGFFTIVLFLTSFIVTCKTNKQIVWVDDKENILTQSETKKFDSLFKAHEKKTTNEVVLVTTPSYGRDTSIVFFAVNYGRNRGIGKKNKNNGLVIVFSRANRETRISTGYGIENKLRDEVAKKIIDSLMIPSFKEGKEFEGLWNGSKAIVEFLERPENKID